MKTLTIAVCSAMEPGTSWAHGINTIKMADGFAKAGHKVHLVTRPGLNGMTSMLDLARYYGISASITWHPLFVPALGFSFQYFERWFAKKASRVISKLNPDFLYARNYWCPVDCAKNGIASVAESHASVGTTHDNFMYMISGQKYSCFKGIVTIANSLKDYYQSCGIDADKVLVLPDSVDLEMFSPDTQVPSPYPESESKKPIVLYSGHLYDYKGIPTVLEAAKKLTEFQFYLLGGWDEDIERHRKFTIDKQIDNVTFLGLKTYSDVPPYLWHADLLLLPPSLNHPSAQWTSPVKLGEYMASKTPIIASDIPALKHWVDESHVEFFQADNSDSLASSIRSLFYDKRKMLDISDNAFNFSKTLTYTSRAQKILEYFN